MIILVAHLINECNYKYNSNWCDHSVYKVWFIFCIDWNFQRRCGSIHWDLIKQKAMAAEKEPGRMHWSLHSEDTAVSLCSTTFWVEWKCMLWYLSYAISFLEFFAYTYFAFFSSWKANNKTSRVYLTKNTSLAPPQLKSEKCNFF